MSKIAIITGPRNVAPKDEAYVASIIREVITRGFQIYVGDATGVDSIAWAAALQSERKTQIFRPLETLGRTAAGLAERSSRMVREARRFSAGKGCSQDELVCLGFPNKPCPESITPAKQWRAGGSGTWSTIALAIGHDIETWIFPIGDFDTPPFWCGTPEIFFRDELQGWNRKPPAPIIF